MQNFFGYLLLVVMLVGCSPWKTTKDLYHGRAFPAQVDLEQEVGLDEKEQRLAREFADLDEKIEKLRQTLIQVGTPPSLDWMRDTVRSMPWLNGLQVVDSLGRTGNRFPETGVKQLNLKGLQEEIATSKTKRLQLVLQETTFGTEVCLAKPFSHQSEYRGFLPAHFDFRTLASSSANPGKIIALVPGRLLWAGDYGRIARELSCQDWEKMLQQDFQGEITLQETDFYWLVRYIGRDPLIYAVDMD